MDHLILEIDEQYLVVLVDNSGYMNLNSLCKAATKRVGDYLRNKAFRDYIDYLNQTQSDSDGLLVDDDEEPVFYYKTSKPKSRYYGHRLIAIDCARWCSPEISTQVCSYYFGLQKKTEMQETERKLEELRQAHSVELQEVKKELEELKKKSRQSEEDTVERLDIQQKDNLVGITTILSEIAPELVIPYSARGKLGTYVSKRHNPEIHGKRRRKEPSCDDPTKSLWLYDRDNEALKDLIRDWIETLE